MEPTILQYGLAGAVLAWFMFRNEKKTDGLTKAINNNNKILLLLIDAVGGCPNNGKNSGIKIREEQIETLKEEILKA